jgi:prophage DNA circulation protein
MSTASDNLASGLAAVAEAIRTASNDPAVQIRLLTALADFSPASDPTGTAALCRRVALISLCRAVSNYVPSSFQDAMTLRSRIASLLDAEILAAADVGQSTTVQAFRTLRQQVSAYLTTEGGALPAVVRETLPGPLPALAVAYRLYADATRADDLIARVDPPNPNFMPISFEALNS